jgi:UDP-N-acetylmuramoyl-tripeptide--D-alanyl-D-alanine ligase
MSGMSFHQVYRALKQDVPQGLADNKVSSFQVDSRLVASDDVFVALPGAVTDGHLFLHKAVEQGAKLLIAERAPRSDLGVPVVLVDDSLQALAKLARYHRAHCACTVIGITGSVGKTTAKDYLQQIFKQAQFDVYAAPKSYNSEIGLPLAMLGAPRSADYVILEYGVNEPGEMDYLIDIVRPDIAAIVSIGAAHLEGMGDLKTIAIEKNKLLQAVGPQGSVWIDDYCKGLIPVGEQTWVAELIEVDSFQYVADFDGSAYSVDLADVGTFHVNCIAEHELRTAMMMAFIALACKASPEQVGAALSELRKPSGRLEQLTVAGLNIINDAYNANPTSMLAALHTLSSLPCLGKRIAILGSMLELGDAQLELHSQIGRSLDQYSIDLVVCVGDLAHSIAKSASSEVNVHCVADCHNAAEYLSSNAGAEDLILFKASRGDKLEQIIPLLEQFSATLIND